jgi:hypothetical protein
VNNLADLRPQLDVKHRIKGPIVDRIANLINALAGDHKTVSVFASADPARPSMWRLTAKGDSIAYEYQTTKLFVGKLEVVCDNEPTVLSGLISIHRALYQRASERGNALNANLTYEMETSIPALWSFEDP